ncbi:MAG: 1-acyl-sn-glycerol-3-phosphate acyltransferase [Bacteroidales bacterium]|nr:1-acyl-sn-glycerol-3-phosphate acyltransferase [Bacteroidales bacterium]MBN2748182.1 1-acyl-sn-glycerol-3-phosphate acyltransferase [Bacteroidales bacterium]
MPTRREDIEKWSMGYHLLKMYGSSLFHTYFPKEVVGIEKIDFNDILIFAPNHQNALIDALAVLYTKNWQPVFLARADIFKKPLLDKFLTFLKIMPVYRIRDGYSNLQLNDAIFQKTLDILKNKNCLVILPEGNHDGHRRLRQLKKGIARIAFQAEEATGNTMNIKIVPVGLEYSHYSKFSSPMLIRFGEPISVSKYYQRYKENPAVANNELMEELATRMKEQMIHIESEEHYNSYEAIRTGFARSMVEKKGIRNSLNNQFLAAKALIAALNTLQQTNTTHFNKVINAANGYSLSLNHYGITQGLLANNRIRTASLALRIPALAATLSIFTYGFLNNALPIATVAAISSKIKDPQFVSSVRYAIGLFAFPIFHAIQALVFWSITGNGIWTLGYLASMPVSAMLMHAWRKQALSAWNDIKLTSLRLTKPKAYREIRSSWEVLNRFTSEIEW